MLTEEFPSNPVPMRLTSHFGRKISSFCDLAAARFRILRAPLRMSGSYSAQILHAKIQVNMLKLTAVLISIGPLARTLSVCPRPCRPPPRCRRQRRRVGTRRPRPSVATCRLFPPTLIRSRAAIFPSICQQGGGTVTGREAVRFVGGQDLHRPSRISSANSAC